MWSHSSIVMETCNPIVHSKQRVSRYFSGQCSRTPDALFDLNKLLSVLTQEVCDFTTFYSLMETKSIGRKNVNSYSLGWV